MFTQNEWDRLHDVVLDATWDTTQVSLTQTELEDLYTELPGEIKADVMHWGLNDSVVRDNIYVWYVKNKL